MVRKVVLICEFHRREELYHLTCENYFKVKLKSWTWFNRMALLIGELWRNRNHYQNWTRANELSGSFRKQNPDVRTKFWTGSISVQVYKKKIFIKILKNIEYLISVIFDQVCKNGSISKWCFSEHFMVPEQNKNIFVFSLICVYHWN